MTGDQNEEDQLPPGPPPPTIPLGESELLKKNEDPPGERRDDE